MATKNTDDNTIDGIVNDIEDFPPTHFSEDSGAKDSKDTKKVSAKKAKSSSKPKSSKPRNIDGFKQPKKKSTKISQPKPTKSETAEEPIVAEESISVKETLSDEAAPASLEDAMDGFANADYDDIPKHPEDYPKDSVPVSAEDTSVAIIEADDMEPTEDESSDALAAEENTSGTNAAEDVEIIEVSDEEPVENLGKHNSAMKEAPAAPEDNVEDADIESLISGAPIDSPKEEPKKSALSKKPKGSSRPSAFPYRIISRILSFLTIIALGTFITYLALSNVLPFKYLVILISIAALFAGFYLFKALRKKTTLVVLTILNILGIALSAGCVLGFLKYNELLKFLDSNFGNSKTEYSIYNVIVEKKSEYTSLDDVKGKEFHSISDFIDTAKLEAAVKDQANGAVVYTDGITSLLKDTMNSPFYIALLNSGTYDGIITSDEGKVYQENLKVIGEIKVKAEQNSQLVQDVNVTTESWIMYISGIDTRSGQMLDRSLSDVNIVMAVNPKTKRILMVAIPRDYYVQLHGTTGLPDKLTHAGSLGGLQLSIDTVKDILGIDINQYLRVNFNAVIGLVDAIGGITVNSDVNYSFKCHTDNNCVINPGLNSLDGKCALAFARERMAYSTGDRHRGENQEQVIEKVFEKITSSNTLIRKYSEILNSLSGSFETSLTTSDITSLVNMQLDNMSTWRIESYNLNGNTGGAYTYSYPSQTLSVMFPDSSTIEIAKKKIEAVMAGGDPSTIK